MRSAFIQAASLTGLVLALAAPTISAEPTSCGLFAFGQSVDPPSPGCSDEITLTLSLWMPDSCWSLGAPVLSGEGFRLTYDLQLDDAWDPDSTGCLHVIIPLSFDRVVGPLEPGPYVLHTNLAAFSARHGDSTCSWETPFDLVCCEGLPDGVGELRLDKTGNCEPITLNWWDVPGANDYFVFGDTAPSGNFGTIVGQSSSGPAGLLVEATPDTEFYLVAARDDCGVGSRR